MRLGTRLLLPLLATVAAVMLLYAAWALEQRRTTLAAEARNETQAYATALGLAIENAFRDRRYDDVQAVIDRISREPKIYGVLVYGVDGKLLSISEVLRTGEPAPPEILRRVLDSGEPTAFERTIVDQHVYAVLRPIRGPDSRIVGAFEVAQPLSFVEAERARTRKRFLLNTLTLLAAVTVVILWLVSRVIARPLDRLVDAVRALGRGELTHRIDDAIAPRELAELAREFNRMADGLERARAELVRQTDERIALERRLRETEKLAAVGNLAAGLAHEIAAPLNVIAGRAEMLGRRETQPGPAQRNLRIIVEQIGRITTIVRNLLDFARRREPRIRPLDVGSVLNGVAEFLEGELSRADVRLIHEGPPTAWVLGDAHLLHQVFLNLLLNAIQALDGVAGERQVVVRVRPGDEGERVGLEVEDTGPGVPSRIRDHIFEPFFTTKTGEGTGLGLAVARSILEEHGGGIDLVETDRRGACFRLHLPAAPAPERMHA